MAPASSTRKVYDFKGISDAELERAADQAHRSGIFKVKLRTTAFGALLAGALLFMGQAATLFGTTTGMIAILGTSAATLGLVVGRPWLEKAG